MYLAGGNGLRSSTSDLRASSGYFEPSAFAAYSLIIFLFVLPSHW